MDATENIDERQKSFVYALMYVMSKEDLDKSIEINQNIKSLYLDKQYKRHKKSLLDHINFNYISNKQKLLLSAYLLLYQKLNNNNETQKKINTVVSRLNVSQKYIEYVSEYYKNLSSDFILENSNNIEKIINPTPDIISHFTSIVKTGSSSLYRDRQILHGLSAHEYEHKLDRQFLEVLSNSFGFDKLVNFFFKHGLERVVTIQYTGSNLRINNKQLPQIYDIILECCKIIEIAKIPDVYVEQGFINAHTVGSETPIVIFSAGCFGTLSHAEQMFISGHELGHIKSQHCLYRTIADIISAGVLDQLLSTISVVSLGLTSVAMLGLQAALMNWKRTSEFTADRAGLLCCQDIDAALSCLIKLSGMSPAHYSSINIDAFKQQAKEFQTLDFNVRDKILKIVSIMYESHPWTIMRAHELIKWHESGEYQSIVERTTKKQSLKQSTSSTIENHESGLRCSSCGQAYEENAHFCCHCGKSVQHVTKSAVCNSCGQPYEDGVSFCSQCGKAVIQTPKMIDDEQTAVCRQCGTKREGSEKFCTECGRQFTS